MKQTSQSSPKMTNRARIILEQLIKPFQSGKRTIRAPFLLLALTVFVCLINFSRFIYGQGRQVKDLTNISADSTGVSTEWWAAVQENIEQSEYAISWQQNPGLSGLAAAYQAPNRAQNLRTSFTPQGLRLTPRIQNGKTPSWQWGLTLNSFGSPTSQKPQEIAAINAVGQRLEYSHSDITEWYLNDEQGLQQGFTVTNAPDQAGETAVLTFNWSGNLQPKLSDNGQAVEWADLNGKPLLRDDNLMAQDRNGRPLPTQIQIDPKNTTIQLVIGVSEANYPLTIQTLITNPDWTAEGNQAQAQFGYSVGTAGDVNNDGYSDIIVGAPYYDNGQVDEGQAFVYYGSAAGLSTTPDWTADSDRANAEFGYSVSTAGDVNHDGYSDVIIGAPEYQIDIMNDGQAFVFHGSPTGLSLTADWEPVRSLPDSSFGGSVSTAGDVNHDGYSDVIVAANGFSTNPPINEQVFVYFGSSSGLSTVANWTVESDEGYQDFGRKVGTAGDVNGDGYSDIIITAPDYENGQQQEGAAFVYHGSATGPSSTPDWTAEGDQTVIYFGESAGTAGDVNGDTYSDVIVGAPLYESGQVAVGAAFVYYGSPTGLSLTADWMAESDQKDSVFGWSVGLAGDINGDGYSDVIVGAPAYSFAAPGDQEGRIFVYFGSAAGLPETFDMSAVSEQDHASLGYSVGIAGDVNGDTYSDFFASANSYHNGQSREGAVFVYYSQFYTPVPTNTPSPTNTPAPTNTPTSTATATQTPSTTATNTPTATYTPTSQPGLINNIYLPVVFQ
ncbi:MAG: integrin alpha [Candidatus Promineifilaceae bacterium]